MGSARGRFVRFTLFAFLAALLLAGLVRVGVLPALPPVFQMGVWLLLPLGLVAAYFLYREGYWHDVGAHTVAEEFPDAGTMRVRPGGEFEWRPRGEIRAAVRHGIVHRWWDAERGPAVGARVEFDIPDEVPAALLRKATSKGLAAAARSLPGRGKVRAETAARDEMGPTSVVRVQLLVQGPGADAQWARAAAEAFAGAFVRKVRGARQRP